MSDNINVNVNENAKTVTAMPTVQYILEQMAVIQRDNAHIHDALNVIIGMPQGDSGEAGAPGDIAGQAKAEAIADIVKCRETTNQKLMEFYEKVYDDLMHRESDNIIMRRMQQETQLKEYAISELISHDSSENVSAAMKILGVDVGKVQKGAPAQNDSGDALDDMIDKIVQDSIAASIAIGEAYSEN